MTVTQCMCVSIVRYSAVKTQERNGCDALWTHASRVEQNEMWKYVQGGKKQKLK